MPLEKSRVQKFEELLDRLNILLHFFILPFIVLKNFFKGKKYFDFK